MNALDSGYASPAVRDGFLFALDRRDSATLTRLALQMTNCGNPLPSTTCVQLGLLAGSTYGAAARSVIDRRDDRWLMQVAPMARAVEPKSTDDTHVIEAFLPVERPALSVK